MKFYRITEALEQRKFSPGTVKFSQSTLNDPHIQAAIQAIAQATGKTEQEVIAYVQEKVAKLSHVAAIAPTLYRTIEQNGIENEVFSLYMEIEIPSPAPKFRQLIFNKLVNTIAGEHDEFWPLRSYIEKRPLQPKWDFVNVPMNDKQGITTAAATPDGTFIFNLPFMQKLMDYSHLKQIKPKGRKYVSNGGDIPDEYGYIEFLIMHELMHYSNDDFYYQKVLPNSNPMIINWVGDFRSNYLLVKSGYEQLPMGLFNDAINYDRQKTYAEMYDLVKSEFEKLPKGDQDGLRDALDKMADDHKPGQKEGAKSDVKPGEMTEKEIDGKAQQTEGQMADAKDQTAEEAKQNKKSEKPGQGKGEGPGSGKDGAPQEIDYSKIRPSFDWKTIVKRFLNTAKPRMEDTYAKPNRRSVSQLDIARQVGAGAIKPGERAGSITDSKLGFVFDASGSMQTVISKVFANAVNLLQTPQFKNSTTLVFRFSSSYSMFKVMFGQNKAAKVASVKDKITNFPLTPHAVFNMAESGGTDFSATMATKIIEALKDKWNLIFFLDDDITSGQNYKNIVNVIKAAPSQVFIVFDSQATYVKFRKLTGIATPNITFFA